MQISFDPRDRNACAAVLASIAALHKHDEFAGAGDAAFSALNPGDATAFEITDDGADAMAAFGSDDADPAKAFAPPTSEADDDQDDEGDPSPAAAFGSVTTDKNGLPWDARIHAGNKSTNADGSWRKRRGVSDEETADVEAELRKIMAAPGPDASGNVPPPPPASNDAAPSEPAPVTAPTVAPAAPPPTPPVVDTAPGQAAVIPAVDVGNAPVATPIAPAAPTVTTPSPVAPSSGEMTFPDLMRRITALQSAGRLTVADTNETAVSLGLTGVRDLVKRPDLVPSFAALLPTEGGE